MHMAAVRNRSEVVQALLDIGCDRTLQNAEGETPLDVARRELRDRAVTRLLEIK
ncbi:MAG: ankyrin repeat domain-containing protein [Gemmatimonadota bacterium]|nr:ankyrin repeat domain-containing protein [Gemmatimonadota bacterium]